MILCLFEDDKVVHLKPLVNTRAVFDLHLGMRSIAEGLQDVFEIPEIVFHTRKEVRGMAEMEHQQPAEIPINTDILFVNGRLVAEKGPLVERILRAAGTHEPARLFVQGDDVIAAWVPASGKRITTDDVISRSSFDGLKEEEVGDARLISRMWHLLDELVPALIRDFRSLTRKVDILSRDGARIHDGAILARPEQIYTAPGVVIRPGAILNAEEGPIFIDRHTIIFEGAIIRGPAYFGPNSQVKTGSNIESCSFGYYCKVGGEIHHSIFHSLSSKPHEGFLGHSYIGRWCNLGADTNNSNLKNDYGIVKLYNTALNDFEDTGEQFLGLIMGDHSKCGITSMFNTGTVVGTFCNLYGSGFHHRYIPSFRWGGPETGDYIEYRLDKALRVAEAAMARRDQQLSRVEQELLSAIYEASKDEHARK